MKEMHVIHPAAKANVGEMWKGWINTSSLWIGNWMSDSKLGDLEPILPVEWRGVRKDNYLAHFRNRKFGATAGPFGEHAARTLRKFYLIPIGSIILAAGDRRALGIARISSKVEYGYSHDETSGSFEERYVRDVDGWIELDILVANFSRRVRNKFSTPQTIVGFPEALFADLLTTVEREKGAFTRRGIENLINI